MDLIETFIEDVRTWRDDPKAYCLDGTLGVVNRAQKEHGVELINELLRSRLPTHAQSLKELMESFQYHKLESAITSFAVNLDRAVADEYRRRREEGRGVPINEVKKWSGTWSQKHWNGHEQHAVLALLEQGETIERVTFREVVTSKKTIDRPMLRTVNRYNSNFLDEERWAQNFTNEVTIAEAERREAEKAAREDRPFWSDNKVGPYPQSGSAGPVR